ncbi:bifunctional riboflavin kinase/FAD synthetase [Marinimicrobium alkaliphilum]|uniref:bifunctional riboflavin kinase/FAD synthetase n=1 Tax=Marinimicrobium alkaliphilum TaxID=2202654 RepID=UPI000DB9DA2B|nr:bifunctional riboflavin kinase/FAD synthetase [Marinimicrobium alkaliphilum]
MSAPAFIRGLHNLRPAHRGCVATIGSFDGVHLGHQAILRQLTEAAREHQQPSVVMIFEPQPHEFFGREQAPARLMRLREKIQALFAAGVDRVFCLQFNAKLRSLSAQAFIDQVLVEGLGVRHLVVGDDFRFGCDRRGDFALLKAAGAEHGFSVTDTFTLAYAGERISSTRIREALEAADFDLAAQLLGRPYSISGRVGHGQRLGRQLGVPTANIQLRRHRSPLHGVYAVSATLEDGRSLPGVANVGVRPTVQGGTKPLLEVHLLDVDEHLYGQRMTVVFHRKQRAEQRFASVADLQAQLHRDIAEARRYFEQANLTT